MSAFGDAGTVLDLMQRLVAVGVCVSSAEMLAGWRHLRDDGLLSWPMSRLRSRSLESGAAARVLGVAFAYPNVLWLIGLRLAAAAWLAAGPSGGAVDAVLLAAVAAISIGIPLRSPFGLDGADQMSVFVLSLLALARLLPYPAVMQAALWFVALQACLSYVTAGVAKAASPAWRSGTALVGISGTRMYGAPPIAAVLRTYPALTPWLSRSVILAECSFAFALVAPPPVALALLAGGLLFHLLSAAFMGLNTFVWPFLSTYPAILFCAARLQGW